VSQHTPAATTAAPVGFGLRQDRVAGFRSARELSFSPGPLCALVGEANVGKSNVLAAIWTLLDPHAPRPAAGDVSRWSDVPVRVDATLVAGGEVALEAIPPGPPRRRGPAVPVVFLSGAARTGPLVARPGGSDGVARAAEELLAQALSARPGDASAAGPALALLHGVEACCEAGIEGLVLLIEEPELYLRPQGQRYLYRLLRELTSHLLDARAGVPERRAPGGARPRPAPDREGHRDRAAVRPGRPRELPGAQRVRRRAQRALPRPRGVARRGTDGEARLPVHLSGARARRRPRGDLGCQCGGKPNIALFARICDAVRVPYLVVHDRDAPPGGEPIPAERAVNAAIAAIAGPRRTIELAPDFEAVAGLHGHSHKPERAWRSFAGIDPARVPAPLAEAVTRVVALARD
jgi:hypothetical protein